MLDGYRCLPPNELDNRNLVFRASALCAGRSASTYNLADVRRLQAGRDPSYLSTTEGKKEKADVVDAPQGFDHVGLLLDGPPGPAGLPFIESSDECIYSFARSRCEYTSPPNTPLYSQRDRNGK
jgi:hypothetical protein